MKRTSQENFTREAREVGRKSAVSCVFEFNADSRSKRRK